MSYFLRESRSKRRHYPKKTFNACLLTYASGRTVCLLRRKSGESYRSFRKRYVDVVADFGGALTAKEDNLIVVAPSVGEIEVELDYFQTNTAGPFNLRTGLISLYLQRYCKICFLNPQHF